MKIIDYHWSKQWKGEVIVRVRREIILLREVMNHPVVEPLINIQHSILGSMNITRHKPTQVLHYI